MTDPKRAKWHEKWGKETSIFNGDLIAFKMLDAAVEMARFYAEYFEPTTIDGCEKARAFLAAYEKGEVEK